MGHHVLELESTESGLKIVCQLHHYWFPRLPRKRELSVGVCHLGKKVKHKKLKALAREILNDWDAVVAAVNNPDLPLTNNEAERALRHAVIARRISYGTRTTEGSIALSCLLSVIETCRLRQVNPWEYISSVIKLARKGLSPPLLPTVVAT